MVSTALPETEGAEIATVQDAIVPLPPTMATLTTNAPVPLVCAVIWPCIQFAGLAVLVMVTHWPTTKALPVWTVSDFEPVPMASEVVLVALVPGALTAVAALAAALVA